MITTTYAQFSHYAADGATLGFIYLKNAAWTKLGATAAEFNAYCAEHPIKVIMPLATPLTYQLTPAQLETLVGTNVVWADCGPVSLEYSGNGFGTDAMIAAIMRRAR